MKCKISFNSHLKNSVNTFNNFLTLEIWNTVRIGVYLLCNKN